MPCERLNCIAGIIDTMVIRSRILDALRCCHLIDFEYLIFKAWPSSFILDFSVFAFPVDCPELSLQDLAVVVFG